MSLKILSRRTSIALERHSREALGTEHHLWQLV